MDISSAVRKACQALFFPQACVVCDQWVLNADFSPLCKDCLLSLKPLQPRICFFCGVPLPGNVLETFGSCSSCRTHPPPFDCARAYGPYEGAFREVIRKFKFEGFQRLAFPLAGLLHECWLQSKLELEINSILPVPLHPKRRRQRGFDQTLLLSRVLSRRLQIPIYRGLRRIRNTIPQFGLDIRERRRNIRGAFALKDPAPIGGSNVLLIDDVLTTGTTVREISHLLRQGSEVNKIVILTIARAPLLYD